MSDYSLEGEIGAMHPSIWDVEDEVSDRSPEPEVKGMIVVDDWVDESVLGAWHFVTSEEVVDLVRRGVESGTIKGEVGRVEGASVMSQEHTELLVWVSRDVAREIVRGGVDVLVIPLKGEA